MTESLHPSAMAASGGQPHMSTPNPDRGGGFGSQGGGFEIPFSKRQRGHEDFPNQPPVKKGKMGELTSDHDLVDKDGSAASGDFNKGSCHQCKSRRAIGDLIFCTTIVDKKNKHCRKKYCESCLKKFYKEDISDPATRTEWSCPSCRNMCCCAACRRRRDPKDGGQVTPQQASKEQHMMSALPQQMMPPNCPQFDSSGVFNNMMREASGGPPISYMPNVGAFGTNMAQEQTVFGQAPPSTGGIPQSSSFAMLYAVAQMPHVRDQIKQILDRTDFSDEEKVESIAALLRRAVVGTEQPPAASSSSRPSDETPNEFSGEEV